MRKPRYMKNIVIPKYRKTFYDPHMSCGNLFYGCGTSFEIEDSDLYVRYGDVLVKCPNCNNEMFVGTSLNAYNQKLFAEHVRTVKWKNSFLYKIFSFMARPFQKDNSENP